MSSEDKIYQLAKLCTWFSAVRLPVFKFHFLRFDPHTPYYNQCNCVKLKEELLHLHFEFLPFDCSFFLKNWNKKNSAMSLLVFWNKITSSLTQTYCAAIHNCHNIIDKKNHIFSIRKTSKSRKYIFTTDKSKITTSIILYFLLFPLVEEYLAWRSTLIAKQKLFCYFQDLFGLQLNIVYTTLFASVSYTNFTWSYIYDLLGYKTLCNMYIVICLTLWCDALNFSYRVLFD